MNHENIVVVNTAATARHFAEGVYMCPNTKSYTFAKQFKFMAGHYNKEILYLAEIRARGTIIREKGEIRVTDCRFGKDDADTIKEQLLEAFHNAKNLGYGSVEGDIDDGGVQIFFFKEGIRAIRAPYVQGIGVWSKVYLTVLSSEKIDFMVICDKLSNQDINALDKDNINLDKLSQIEIPQAFLSNVNVSQDFTTSDSALDFSRKVLFCNIAWMDEYKGEITGKMRSGGEYVRKHGIGGELYNFFTEADGYCYGYVRSAGGARISDIFESVIDLGRLDPAHRGKDKIDDVLVIWIANNPDDKLGTRIVGFYENATVFSNLQKTPGGSKREYDYIIRTESMKSHLISTHYRKYFIPRRKKGFLGQSNVWYCDSAESQEFKKKVLEYFERIKQHSVQSVQIPTSVSDPIKTFVIPYNPTQYDLDAAFNKFGEIEWTQNLSGVSIDDIVYIYAGQPFQKIAYKCVVTAVDFTKPTIDDSEFILTKESFAPDRKLFRLKLLKKTSSSKLSLDNLKSNGLNGNIQSARGLSDSLLDYVDREFDNAESQEIISKDEREALQLLTEEETEAYFNAADDSAGYRQQQRLVKIREVNLAILRSLKEHNRNCQLCGERGEQYGVNILEGHHIEYFCQTQNNDSTNIIILCPNCHTLIHKLNAQFNRERLSYLFSGQEKYLKHPMHLRA
ncbi:MAG: HNH endonuclease [Firmicutes bacterium]|nr:HNH endonuclease [Bacillota bacterium]